jgi:hypothetical protein
MSDRRERSSNVTTVLVVLALLLCAESAFGQTRPIISEVFQSPLAIEVTTGGEISEGWGYVSFDQPAGKAREFYAFESGQTHEILTRYDLGKIFTIANLRECDVTEVTGTMPPTWAWIQQAKQGPTEVIDGITVVSWIGASATPPLLTIWTTIEDHTVPVFLDVVTPERSVRVRFLNWRTSTPNPHLFNTPRRCPR